MRLLLLLLGLSTMHLSNAACPPGSIESDDGKRCFMFIRTEMSFAEASNFCVMFRAQLTSVVNEADNNRIQATVYMAQTDPIKFWIGAAHQGIQGTWIWIDGSPWDYENWDGTTGGGGCAVMDKVSGTWSAQGCSERKSFVCELLVALECLTTDPPPSTVITTLAPLTCPACPECPTTPKPVTTTLPPSNCPVISIPNSRCPIGWAVIGAECFIAVDQPIRSYNVAISTCTGLNSQIASIHSAQENEFSTCLMKAPEYWIGFKWMGAWWSWVDGSKITYKNWTPGFGSANNKQCSYINKTDGKWYSALCNEERGVICKKAVAF